MTRLISWIRFTLCCLACVCMDRGEAKIIETAHIADVVPLIDEQTWFLVDLDNTLFQGAQALGHCLWFYDQIEECLEQGMSRNEAIHQCYHCRDGWIRTQQIGRVKPLEEDFVPSIHALQQRGIVVMGFTHRHPPVAEATVRQVTSLGVDFTLTAPHQESFVMAAQHPMLYQTGIFFASDYNKKGDVLLPFLDKLEQRPKKIVFIDDKKKNVEELEAPLAKEGIEYIGVYYTAIDYAEKVYDPAIAKFQSKFLDQILSNEAATLLMDSGLE